MPMIEFTYSAGSIDESARAELLEELSTALLAAEGAPDTEFFRSITWTYAHELPAGTPAVGGRPGGEPRFRIDFTVPEGALREERKAKLVSRTYEAVARAAGLGEAQALHVWSLIHEVPDGNWGAGGQVIRFAQLRDIAGAEREQASAGATAG